MSTADRPDIRNNYATFLPCMVATSQAATKGMCAEVTAISATNGVTVKNGTAANDLTIGFFTQTKTAGEIVEVQLFCPTALALVGTGGSTVGKPQKAVTDGVTDAPAHATSGGTSDNIVGIALDTGVAGDHIAIIPIRAFRGST